MTRNNITMARNNMNRNRRAIGTTLGVHYGPEDRNWVRKGKVRVIRRKRHTEHAELAAHAREFQRVFMANRLLVPRQSLQTLAEWNADEQYGHEWRLNAARTDEELIAVYQAQLADYAVTKERLATERILRDDAQKQISAQKAQLVQAESNLNATQKMLDATIAERDELHAQITALMTERDTLAAKLDAANAKLAALENAALVAESAPAPADAPDDVVTVALMDERARPPMKLTPPARKPDAAA